MGIPEIFIDGDLRRISKSFVEMFRTQQQPLLLVNCISKRTVCVIIIILHCKRGVPKQASKRIAYALITHSSFCARTHTKFCQVRLHHIKVCLDLVLTMNSNLSKFLFDVRVTVHRDKTL